VDSLEDGAAILLANWLKDETEEATPELAGFYADLLNAALSEVNWNEIATHWVEVAAAARAGRRCAPSRRRGR
jgi:hypothetical protein